MLSGILIDLFRKIDEQFLVKTTISIFIALWIHWLWSRRKFYILSLKMSGPLSFPLIGNALDLGIFSSIYDIVKKITVMASKYKDNFCLWIGSEFLVVLCEADDLETLLTSKASITKDSRYDMFKICIGDGLLIGSGNLWKKHRQIINPSFNIATLRSYQPIYNKYSKYLIEELEKNCNKGLVNVDNYSKRYIADIIMDALFGESLKFYNGNKDDIIDITIRNTELIVKRMSRFWLKWDFIYKLTKDFKYLKETILPYKNTYHEILKEKLKKCAKMKTSSNFTQESNGYGRVRTTFEVLADAFLKGEITEHEVLGEFDNIFNPGLETTSSNISLFIMMIAMHEGPRNKLIKEIDSFYGDDQDSNITQEQFRNFPYLNMCFKEVTRLFPTGPIVTRDLLEDFNLKNKNIVIPAGTHILISLYTLHRNPKYWDNPNSFIPERFSEEKPANRPHFAYMPFLTGQRNCIGQRVAVDAIKTIIVHLMRKFNFHSDLKMKDLKLKADVSMKSSIGYKITVTRRQR